MDLSGTLKTPLGDVSKKTAILAGGALTISAIIWYRSYQAKQAKAASVAAAGQSEINPATGYPYGSAEDAAALAAQASYQFPGGGGGGGSNVGTGTVPTGFVTNAQWTQAVLDYWQTNSLGEPALMATALGVYLAAGVPTDDQHRLIEQAVAIEGYPPQAGSNGYPPHINTAPPGNTTPPPSGGGDTHETGEFAVWVYGAQKVDDFTAEIRRRRGHDVDWSAIERRNPGLAGNINWGPSGSKDTSIRKFKTAQTYTIPVG